MKKTLTIAAITLLFACSTSKTTTSSGPTQSDVDRMQTKYPGYTLAELQNGQSLYKQYCGSCHGLKNPKSYSEEQWNRLVPGMSKKVNNNNPGALDEKAEESILKYVITMCSASTSN